LTLIATGVPSASRIFEKIIYIRIQNGNCRSASAKLSLFLDKAEKKLLDLARVPFKNVAAISLNYCYIFASN